MSRWMAEALAEALSRNLEVVLVLRCTNTHKPRRPFAHAVYYAINLAMMRGPEERPVTLSELGLGRVPVHAFAARADGAWQKWPEGIDKVLSSAGCDVVIKVGMGLLRDPDACGARHGVLSFHHGDPSEFRGRPAGFYELLQGRSSMGIIVQRLSNRLDGGQILAFARSRVTPHSYRQTLAAARRNSRPLLAKAIQALRASRPLSLGVGGRNYRLPGNRLALGFLALLAGRSFRRLLYGAFFEKKWQVARSSAPADILPSGGVLPQASLPAPRKYVFVADCFLLPDGSIAAEAMRRLDGKGEIVRMERDGSCTTLSDEPRCHWSYPFVVQADGAHHLLPEVASWSAPFLQEIADDGTFGLRRGLAGLEAERLVDPTWLRVGGVDYIFAGKPGTEADQLHLWYSRSGIFGPYQPHPDSPVVVDATRARMAGGFLRAGDRLFRPGQDSSGSYGDGVRLCEVVMLTPDDYREVVTGSLRMAGARGPHTYSQSGSVAVYDWYQDRFSILAGLRRLRARF